MSFFDKVLFWRKEDNIDKLASQEMNDMPDFLGDGTQDKSAFPEPGSSPETFQPAEAPLPKAPGMQNKDLELISSKLDTLKAMLNSIDQRMSNLEKPAGAEKKQRLW